MLPTESTQQQGFEGSCFSPPGAAIGCPNRKQAAMNRRLERASAMSAVVSHETLATEISVMMRATPLCVSSVYPEIGVAGCRCSRKVNWRFELFNLVPVCGLDWWIEVGGKALQTVKGHPSASVSAGNLYCPQLCARPRKSVRETAQLRVRERAARRRRSTWRGWWQKRTGHAPSPPSGASARRLRPAGVRTQRPTRLVWSGEALNRWSRPGGALNQWSSLGGVNRLPS